MTTLDLNSDTCTQARVVFGASTDIRALVREHLAPSEQAAFESKSGASRLPWLLGRTAAKKAVAEHLAAGGIGGVESASIVIDNDENGCPVALVKGLQAATRDLRVSIAHKPTMAVAIAGTLPIISLPPGRTDWPVGGVGIDIETIESRKPIFATTILTQSERLLLSADADRDRQLTCAWAVKEAAAKATGRGLRGRPKDFEIDQVDGDRYRCHGRWIATELLTSLSGRHVVAWTTSCETEQPW